MKRCCLFLVLFIVSVELFAQAEEWLWARRAGGTENDLASAIAIDAAGNSYVAGDFQGTADFGNTSLTSDGEHDILVAKLGTNGNWLWAKKAGGASYDQGQGIAADAAGNCYISGIFRNTANFGGITLTGSGTFNIFVAKLDTNGNWLWAKNAGGSTASSIAIDTAGNCYVCGNFTDTTSFGSIILSSSGVYDIFIAKLDTDGNWLWAKKAGGVNSDSVAALTIDDEENCYVTGQFSVTANFGNFNLNHSQGGGSYVAKLDTDGNWLWAEQAGGRCRAIAADATGNCYMCGDFTGGASFGNIILSAGGPSNVFVAKLDTNGNWLWAAQSHGMSTDYARGIATDDAGNCYVTGHFSGTANFGSISLNSVNVDTFIAKLDADGNWLWVNRAEGAGAIRAYAIAMDIARNFYVSGNFYGIASFGNSGFSNAGGTDIFVAKLGVPDYQVLAPNGSENWYADTVQTVYWSSNSLSHVNVLLSLNNGQDWTLLNGDPVLTSLGSFSFIVPHVSSENCLIKVENAENGVCFDVSDACFSIRDETLPVELLSFTATITAENFVQINWTTGHETDLLGFSIWRNAINEQSSAICVSPLIPACNCTYPQNYVFTDNNIEAGSWYYWLEALEFGGSQYLFGPLIVTLSNVGLQQTPGATSVTGIKSIYPNPFNPRTTITIELSKPSNVQIGIYNLKGELIRKLDSSAKMAGIHNILWDGLDDSGRSCCSGIYLFRLTAEGKSSQAKLTLLK